MTDELRTALDRAAGPSGDRPALDGLWATGRGRRRRNRLATGTAAVVAVVALVVGTVALAGGGDAGQDVVAGPTDQPTAPPTEPTDVPITMAITTPVGADPDGTPLVEPGGSFTITFGGAAGYRHPGTDWEGWDGTSWTHQHDLLGGEVLPADATDTMSSTRELGSVSYTAPDAPAGWYRVCAMAWAETGPPASGEHAPPVESVRPCAQLRVPPAEHEDDGAPEPTTAATAPVGPPSEPELPVTLELGRELSPGGLVFGDFVWADGASGTRSRDATWEAWDGTTWTATHQTTITGADDIPEIHPHDERLPVELGMVPAEGRVAFLTPPATEAPPGTYRLCLAVAVAGTERTDTLCEQITLTEPELVMGHPDRDAATWVVDPDDPPTSEDQVISVLVTRVRCTDGAAGPLLEPELSAFEEGVTIMFTSAPGTDDCPADEPVRREVDLGAPLGDRFLTDGICGGQEEGLIPACDDGTVRWPQR